MFIELKALQSDIPAIAGMKVQELCECLAMMGFPVDSVSSGNNAAVLEVDVTANRGDALSHRGLARDLAAKLDAPLTPILMPQIPEGEAKLSVRLEADACPLYATAIMQLDCAKPDQTPKDVADFLAAVGSSAKGLAPVDASNELLHRYGHPTHAFDADKLRGCVCVRWAKNGETLLALDGIERKLDAKDMVIADDSGPIALAGVIGGEATKVTESTKRVLLESAYFDPRTVRAAAHRHGIHTDASHRFGRGADIAIAPMARDLLAHRLISWAGAELVSSWTMGKRGIETPATLLTNSLLDRIAGQSIQLDEAVAILRRLGCRAASSTEGLTIQPPSWRHDLSIPEDYAEEVLRMRGYDTVGAALPPIEGVPEPMPHSYQQRRALSRRLAHLGFYQAVTFGFVGPKADAAHSGEAHTHVDSNDIPAMAESRALLNPLGLEYSVMRASLLPSLWNVAEANMRNGAKEVRIFEIAPIYESRPDGPTETSAIGLVWTGHIGGEDPLTPLRPVMAADLIASARDIGYMGDIVLAEFGQNAFGVEITLDKIGWAAEAAVPIFKPFSRYPVVVRDLSLLVPLGLCYSDLEASIVAILENAPLRSVKCVDVFKDAKLKSEGNQAWLIRLRFQSPDRTLTGDEVESWIKMAIDAVVRLGGILRG
jgi:phenylalanyl-tRNA synthetase beta chain